MLDSGDLVDVLERDLSADLVAGIHCTAYAALSRFNIGGIQQQVGGGRSAEVEGERPVRTDGDTCWDRNTRVNMGGTGVEFLETS